MSDNKEQLTIGAAALGPSETEQAAVWKGDFGREYTDRNTLDVKAVDELYRKNYGLTRSQINENFLRGIAKDASFLEVGCNTGNQLLFLQTLGWSNLSGVELQPHAIEIARSRVPNASIQLGSALALPYKDSSFEVVFTSGVLIHIAPHDLPRAMDEIYRTSKKYIWGLEYYSAQTEEVQYRSHSGLLWKTDFARHYLDRFENLELVQEQHLPYREHANVDTVFLLRKKH